jgi:hypothetical protein
MPSDPFKPGSRQTRLDIIFTPCSMGYMNRIAALKCCSSERIFRDVSGKARVTIATIRTFGALTGSLDVGQAQVAATKL